MGVSLRRIATFVACVLFLSTNIFSDFVCSSKKSRMKMMDSTTKFTANANLTYSGTLEYTGNMGDRLLGSGSFGFSGGTTEGSSGSSTTSASRANSTTFSVSELGGNYYGSCYSAAWSPDGNYVALGSSGNQNRLRVFSHSSGVLTELDEYSSGYSSSVYVKAVAWHPDGNYIACAWSNGSIYVFGFSSNTLTYKNTVSKQTDPTGVAWSPDGDYLAAVGSSNGAECLWVIAFSGGFLGSTLSSLNPNSRNCVAWDPTGEYLAAGGSNLFIYRSTNGVLEQVGDDYSDVFVASSLDWSGIYLAIGTYRSSSVTHRVYSINLTSGLLTQIGSGYDHEVNVTGVSWGSDGSYLAVVASASGEDSFRIYSASDGVLTEETTIDGPSGKVDWSSGGIIVAGVHEPYPANDYETTGAYTHSSGALSRFSTYDVGGDAISIDVNSSETKFFSGSGSNNVKSYTMSGSTYTLADDKDPTLSQINSIDLSTDGNYLVIGGYRSGDETHCVYEVESDTTLTLVPQDGSNNDHGNTVRAVAWSPNGSFLAIGGDSSTSVTHRVYTALSGELSLATQSGGTDNFGSDVYALAWAPDSDYLAVGGWDQGSLTHKVYSVNGSGVFTFVSQSGGNDDHGDHLKALAWSPDGNYLAVGGDLTGGVTHRVYSVASGVLTQVGTGYIDSYYATSATKAVSLAWSPDSDYLAVAIQVDLSYSGIDLYSVDTGVLTLQARVGIGDKIWTVKWNSDATKLYFGCERSILSNPKSYAIYSPNEAANATQTLSSGATINSSRGTIDDAVAVAGTGNVISGSPSFSEGITLNDASAELTLQMTSKLDANLALGSGTVILGSDLSMADGYVLTGDGKVDFDGKSF
ncbi:WD40 repeat domain-containing protein, partial [bacterium]|nr:WD40 repeat domain-containing protein [bacterium]